MNSDQIQKQASEGDRDAQFALATDLNNKGEGREAMGWFEKAARQNHADASVMMAFASAQGQLIEEDARAAINYLERAVAADHAFATQALASAKIEGFGTEFDWPGAMDLLCSRAAKGEPQFLRQVAALLYLSGARGTAIDLLHQASGQDAITMGLFLRALRDEGLTFENEKAEVEKLLARRYPLSADLRDQIRNAKLWSPTEDAADWTGIRKTLELMPLFEGQSGERLHKDPDIDVHHEKLPGLIGDYVRAMAAPLMRPAQIVDPTTGSMRQDPYRRAKAATFAPLSQDAVISTLDRILMRLSGLPFENGERMGVLSYLPGEEYKPHYDCFLNASDVPQAELDRGGQRVRTVLLIVHDDFEGGGTSFPKLDIMVSAMKGSVVVFDNVDEDGNPETKSLHAGEPVTSGTKWIATKWIRANAYQKS